MPSIKSVLFYHLSAADLQLLSRLSWALGALLTIGGAVGALGGGAWALVGVVVLGLGNLDKIDRLQRWAVKQGGTALAAAAFLAMATLLGSALVSLPWLLALARIA
ncbi:hypothetical protein [Devosia sp. FKR38]|uniref:hypothetical protein n=1 Tax=Devosia sp. FKR38 TaxID=2562312 RepID=UPI0010C12809|nr:hypothetical protein [Devosia sp. FKR38]